MGGDHTGRDGDDRSLWTGEAEDPGRPAFRPGGDAGQGAGRRGGDDHAALCPYAAGTACCPEGCLAALLGELNQIQDHQNQILAELLRALERMADALERR